MTDVEAYVATRERQLREIEETLKRSTDLNQRQLALLAHAIRHRDAEYTIRSHMTSHAVAYATARADLSRRSRPARTPPRRPPQLPVLATARPG